MYRVMVSIDGIGYPLHEPMDNEGKLQLIDPVVTLEMGKNGQMTFRIAPSHPHKGMIKPMKSEVVVYQDDEIIFAGRPIGDESDFHNLGKVTCEGELAYLIDSIQRPYDFTGTGQDFMRQCLDVHNGQVEARKQFLMGDYSVPDTAPEIIRSSKDCTNTLKTLKSQLVERNGGYLRVRHDGGKRYLDYVSDYGGINGQVIRFGENLLDLSKYIKPTTIITALIPYGAIIESGDTDVEDTPLDISSVNGGKDYIHDQAAVDAYGWIWGVQTFDDVTDPSVLMEKGKAYLQECIALPETLDITAVDMHLVDVEIQKLRLGYWTQVQSLPHGISRRFMLSKKTIHLDNPGKDTVILGQTLPVFTASANKDQSQVSDRIDRVASNTSREINKKIENATQLITGGKGGYFVISMSEDGHPSETLWMDTPDKETATYILRANKNGIGFSRTGINGPYENAWTIDGNLVADFITAGTMLADRIRGGTLEVGGKGLGKDGIIRVLASDGKEICRFDRSGATITDGKINAPDIIGGSANFGDGLFEANDNMVYLGGFYASNAHGRNIFQSFDDQCGISAEPSEKGGLWMWAGWINEDDFDFCVNNLGELHVRELYIKNNQGFWKGWNLSDTMEDVYNRIDNLKNQIDSL